MMPTVLHIIRSAVCRILPRRGMMACGTRASGAQGMCPAMWLLLALFALLAVMGCSAPKSVEAPKKPAKEKPAKEKPYYTSRYRPSDTKPAGSRAVRDTTTGLLMREAAAAQVTTEDSSSTSAHAQTVQPPAESRPAQREERTMGYRVQLCAVPSLEEAQQLRARFLAMADTALAVDMVFDAPYYKLRTGNFEVRKDAEVLRDALKQKGINEAWIVRSQIVHARPDGR